MAQTFAPCTVIIPSYRRPESLVKELIDLSAQTLKPEKVIIVDSSPEDLLLDRKDFPSCIAITYLTYQGIPNVSRQRNIALRKVQTPWILFLDDDVKFEPDLIEKYFAIIEMLPYDGINGLIKLPKYEKYYSVKPNTQRLRRFGGINYQGSDQIIETYVICTANFLARTEAVLKVGGFDEQITGTIDDVDLGLRMKANGYHIIHHPEPGVLHLQYQSSGARSFGLEWSFANLFYFQYRHFEDKPLSQLLIWTLWQYCRPSRDWLHPEMVIHRIKAIFSSHAAALKRLEEGPKLLESQPKNFRVGTRG